MDRSATRPDARRPDPSARRRGVTLAGRYRLDRQIAVGGMGEVWAASDLVLDRRIAVKLLRGDVSEDPTLLRRFRAEARHAAALTHPGVARVYDYGEDALADSVAFLVMELVDGQPLSAAARSRPMPAAAVIGLLTQAADALGAAHALGLVHRDVKPGNLLLSSNGVLKITDFGIAHAIGSAVVTDDGKVAGTARYMSPEQATGGPVAASSDVYSLAVVGYQLLAGRTPFDGAPAAVALAHVRALPPPLPARTPADLRALIEQSLDKDPAKRPANGDVMAAELRGLTDAPSMVAAPSGHAAVTEGAPLADEAAATVLDATQVWSTQPSLVSTSPRPTAMLVDASRSRRRSRRLALAVAAVCVVALGVLGARADSTSGPNGQIPASSTTVAPTEPAPTTATPATPAVISTTTAAPTPVEAGPPAPGKRNGDGNDKGKGKGKKG